MTLKRTATVLVAGAAFAAWLAGAATSFGRRSAEPRRIDVPPVDSRGAALASEIARLHERLRPSATPNDPGRNLFAFGTRTRRFAPPTATAAVPADEARPRPVVPPLRLSGLAEDSTPEGTVRTAIISGLGHVFLVKEGEDLAGRYRVVRISSDVVELSDLRAGSVFQLALK